MSSFLFLTIVSALILLILLGRAIYVMRQEKDEPRLRGSEPGKGYHTIHAEYASGLGGHHTSYDIPKDPQEYARLFVPKPDRSDDGQ